MYYQEQRALNAYLLQNADQVRQQSGKPAVNLAPEQLQGLVTQNTQQHGLVVERFDSDGEGLLVSLAAAPFESLLRCLSELQAQGEFTHVVVNDRLEDAVAELEQIVRASTRAG